LRKQGRTRRIFQAQKNTKKRNFFEKVLDKVVEEVVLFKNLRYKSAGEA